VLVQRLLCGGDVRIGILVVSTLFWMLVVPLLDGVPQRIFVLRLLRPLKAQGVITEPFEAAVILA
jgi:hypothetical protein